MCSVLKNKSIYSPLDCTSNFPWSEFSVGGEKYQETAPQHTHKHIYSRYIHRADYHQDKIKKVNKHLVMKINDTNHTWAPTHFSLFNCTGWDTLILITNITALVSFSVRLQSSPCAYHYRWAFKAIIISMTKVLTSTLRWVLLMQ